ncbi:hypothetical protein FNV64_02035 [Streptomyces sp. S1A1-7]|uniref:Pycsar system effector family protein n=1 Tax=unclassified Streptomyces TaxID=2593676 RepID=UPI0011649755|nr:MULTISPECIES: Pycsar system effector family protein [unclassified Streptomyces]QDN74657.1 hypothetical protein FNV64_02035 [Streptomyces sp. S1A1-7]QDN93355.1 hypothetical protein FNV61_55540 [Streptomyces sp. RLB3-6]
MDDCDNGGPGTAHQQHADWLRARTADAFTEVQRADTKATALCGAAGGLLTVGMAALSQVGDCSWVLVVGLGLGCSFLAAALCAALWVIRPVLPRGSFLAELAFLADDDAEALGGSVSGMSREEQLRVDVFRLWNLGTLAHRKFRIARVAVDLIAAAHLLAGMGLLIAYIIS